MKLFSGFHTPHSSQRQQTQPAPVTCLLPEIQELLEDAPRWEYGQILENIDVGVLVLDLVERRIDYRNPVFFSVVHDPKLNDSFERLEGLILDGLEMPEVGAASLMIPYQDRTFGCSVYRLGERYRCVFIRDISEKVRLESIAQAVNTTDNIGLIFSGVRHEIGNPLNSLKMALSVLRSNLDQFDRQTVLEYIDRGLADIGRVEFLLKSMKSFAVFERIELHPVDLEGFLQQFLALLKHEFEQRGIVLRYEPKGELLQVLIDKRALHQALLNLIVNATDALAGTVDPEIHVFAEERDQLVRLVVSDNGRGISEEQKKHLFQPFNTSKEGGNGLGLVITRKLLAQMNADISIESSLGNGTLAMISLPVAMSEN